MRHPLAERRVLHLHAEPFQLTLCLDGELKVVGLASAFHHRANHAVGESSGRRRSSFDCSSICMGCNSGKSLYRMAQCRADVALRSDDRPEFPGENSWRVSLEMSHVTRGAYSSSSSFSSRSHASISPVSRSFLPTATLS